MSFIKNNNLLIIVTQDICGKYIPQRSFLCVFLILFLM